MAELSELHIRSQVVASGVHVIVTHLPSGTVVTRVAASKKLAKYDAYVEMARLLGADQPKRPDGI